LFIDLVSLWPSIVGQPGRVHISEATRKFLEDEYDMELGETVEGMPTAI